MKVKRLPGSRLTRVGRLAWLGARAGSFQLKGLVDSEGAARQLAAAALETLGELRGLAAKAGQLASYVDGLVPAEHREIYEQVLGTLRAAAPSMSPEAAARVVEQELGEPPDRVFLAFESEPFASASIGQVHRAVTQDGEPVAVKVQLEGAARAVKGDLANAGLLVQMVPFTGRMGVREQVGEIRARFLEELDYRHEAGRQQEFARAFAGDPRIRIPRVHAQLSSARVLTTDFADGTSFEEGCAASKEERALWLETLWRFVFESILVHGLFNADPHPGNYRLEPGGVVQFLDFGCTRRISASHLQAIRRAHAAAARGDRRGMREGMLRLLNAPREGVLREVMGDYLETCFEPVLARGPFHLTRDFAASLLTGLQEKKFRVLRDAPTTLRAPPAEWLFFNRLQIGFYSVLARLDVPADYARMHAAILEKCGA